MKNKAVILILLLAVLLSYILGTILAKGFIEDKNLNINNFKVNEDGNTVSEVNYKYIVIQGGLFKNKANADKVYEKLKTYGVPFIINENDSYRVLLGFFTESGWETMKNKMDKDNVANSKINYEIKGNDLCDQEIGKIIDGLIQIEGNLLSDSITGVKTEEFKNWIKELKDVDKTSPNYNSLIKLKDLINNMGEMAAKKDLDNYNKLIYEVSDAFKISNRK